jgi:hypothetical protein
MSRHTKGRMERQIGKQTDGLIDWQTDVLTNRQTFRKKNRRMDELTYKFTDSCWDEQTDRQTHLRMDKHLDRQTHG